MILKTKICAVIVTFNPEMSRFLDNVDAVTKQVDELIIVDNGSTNIAIIEKELREKDIRCTLIPLLDNKGIGAALNRAIEYCSKYEINYLLTLDQDSVVTDQLVDGLLSTINTATNIAMVGPKISDVNESDAKNSNESLVDTYHLITSGALCRVSHLVNVGMFNEKLFIDCVDFDMSLKLIQFDYKVIRNNKLQLIHEIGRKQKKRILNREFYLLNHSEVRVYYMVRNRLFIVRKYWNLEGYRPLDDLKHLLTRTLAMLCYEERKFPKLIATLKGIFDSFSCYRSIMK
ncbi:hypothetical protein BFS86_03440 [Shewanella algae]|nr:hypothetical protein BFS86_03440 [Shewanella algae]